MRPLLLTFAGVALGALVLTVASNSSRRISTRALVAEDMVDAHLVTTVDCNDWELRSYDNPRLAIVRTSRTRPAEIANFGPGSSEWLFLGARFVDAGRLVAFSRSFAGAVTPYSSVDCGAHWIEGETIRPHSGHLELTIDGGDLLVTSFEWELVEVPSSTLRQKLRLEQRPQHSMQGTRLFTSHDLGKSWASEFPALAPAPIPNSVRDNY
jgi:hypothetical protein